MSAGWQQYPQHPGGYPPQGAYPPQGGYPPHGGFYPQGSYAPQGAYPQQGGFSHPGSYQEGYSQAPYGQYPPVQRHAYVPYAQGYGPQPGQYSYAPQPSGYNQPSPYQPQFPPGPQPYPPAQDLQQQQRPPHNSCYNCGAPDHWAQHCPEPKREVPHGQLMESSARPTKRFRPNYIPPVVTKYPVPPHLGQQQPTPPSFTPSPNWTQPPTTSSVSHGLPTPTSQWQGQTPQHRSNSDAKSFGQSSPSRTGSARPSITVLTDAPTQGAGLHTPPYGGDQQLSTNENGKQDKEPKSTLMSRRASTNTSVSMESESDCEPDVEDYLLLDIPDMPSRIDYPDAKRPQLVEVPLPPLYGDDDDPITHVKPDKDKSCAIRSKYQKDWSGNLSPNVRESKDFSSLQDDPIFILLRPDPPAAEAGTKRPISPNRIGESDPGANTARTQVLSDTPLPEKTSDSSLDALEASPVDLQRLIRKYYSDAAPQKLSKDAPPPPPPPPPLQHHGSRGYTDSSPMSPPRGYRRQNSHSAHSPTTRHSDERSPTSGRSRKRERDDDEPHRPDGERQHDHFTPKTRRNAPKVAEVYSRRW